MYEKMIIQNFNITNHNLLILKKNQIIFNKVINFEKNKHNYSL
jgi:hypothetical protein